LRGLLDLAGLNMQDCEVESNHASLAGGAFVLSTSSVLAAARCRVHQRCSAKVADCGAPCGGALLALEFSLVELAGGSECSHNVVGAHGRAVFSLGSSNVLIKHSRLVPGAQL